jgi:S1-C subfamily serine protease
MNQLVIKKYSSLMVMLLSTFQVPVNAENITIKVYDKVSASVVLIKAYSKKHGDSQGSGVLIDDGKTIVTNLHVVQNATRVNIEFPDGRNFRAKGYLAVNVDKDLITIRLPKKMSRLNAIKIADLNSLRVGQKVVAIGSPQGLSNTVSEGIISAIRELNSSSKVIQTTAPLSPGSSGGGLFNESGRLVGITSFNHVDGQNLNFAYPAEEIKPLLKEGVLIPFYQLQRSNLQIQKSPEVFVTRSGKKYHHQNCHYLRKSRIPISILEASNKGYLPCNACIR